MESTANNCSNRECRFAIDSKCVEGYPLDECPHVRQLSVDELDESSERPVVPDTPQAIALDGGEALDRAQAALLQRRRISRAIGLIGPNNAGKTTLIASVFDLLQEGPIANVGFAGSSTLVGFEKICHDARAASRRGKPHTERTSVGVDATFFHLDVRPPSQDVVSLFIGDRSGEEYLGAADEISRASDFFELRRADTVTLLVNGDHLAGSEHRHEAKAVAPQVVEALIEGGAIRQGTRLAVVLTKQDLVLASPHSERATREFNQIVDTIKDFHRGHFDEVRAFTVAASPADTAMVARGQGIDKLLLYWLRPNSLAKAIPSASVGRGGRMIDLLGDHREHVAR